MYLGSRYRLSFSEIFLFHKQGRKINSHPTGRTGIWRTRRVIFFVTSSSRSRKIECHSINRPCRPTLSMTASSMVVIANPNSFCSSRSKNWCDRKNFDAAIVKSIKISRPNRHHSKCDALTECSSSSIEWSLFEVLSHFLAQDLEIWTIALVASTFSPNVDIGPHEKFIAAIYRTHTSELQLRLSPAKLIWAFNSLASRRSQLSPHDWESWNQNF